MFGEVQIEDALKEVFLVSYDYKSQEPRMFSKFAKKNGGPQFNLLIKDAAQASAAAPTFFDPKVVGEGENQQILIDGAVIANNPALYAFLHAKYKLNMPLVRVVSIGTGTTAAKGISSENMKAKDWIGELGNLVTEVESLSHEYILKTYSHYHRFQSIMDMDYALDAVDEPSRLALAQLGR